MSWLKKLGIGAKSSEPKSETATVPPPSPPPATREEIVAVAAAAGMPEDETAAYADSCVERKLGAAAVSVELFVLTKAEREQALKDADAAKALASANAGKADAAEKAALAAKAAADASKAEADRLAAELKDTTIKIGGAGKGLDPKEAPPATDPHAGRGGGGTPAASGAPSGPRRLPGALGMGNTHEFEQELTRRVAAAGAGARVGDVMAALRREKPESYAAFRDWQEDHGRSVLGDKFAAPRR